MNMPAGEFFDLIRPAFVFISVFLSAWVLASARKRFSSVVAFAWAIATLFLPLVVLPLYLAVILLWRRPVRFRRWRLLLPLAYSLSLLVAISIYLYWESQGVDAHLARATQAKLIDDHTTAIREYRQALAIENNAHTRKLLAIELAENGDANEAISEFRLAQQAGEPISCPANTPKCAQTLRQISGLGND